MKFRIIKKHTDGPMASIVEADTIDMADRAAMAQFALAVNSNPQVPYEIVDYEQALISTMENPELLENPTGGRLGKLLLPGKDFDGRSV